MNRRQFLGCSIGSAITLSGLFRIEYANAIPPNPILLNNELHLMTNGDIATINHLSSLDRLRKIFLYEPTKLANSEAIINGEFVNSQFLGDYQSLDRLVEHAAIVLDRNPNSAAAYIQAAQISASRHEFAQSLEYLDKANTLNADPLSYQPLKLSIDQALGGNETQLLTAREKLIKTHETPENLIPYAALLADMDLINEADAHYQLALNQYKNISPFIPAWICFQLGTLWGEGSKLPNYEIAKEWYRKALTLLPTYTKARIHLAETYNQTGNTDDALQVLLPAIESTDPEVSWRLSELYASKNENELSSQYLSLAHSMFSTLLSKHQLAFADHASEFYATSGNNHQKALNLALINYKNRPTKRAAKLIESTRKLTV